MLLLNQRMILFTFAFVGVAIVEHCTKLRAILSPPSLFFFPFALVGVADRCVLYKVENSTTARRRCVFFTNDTCTKVVITNPANA
jgi:hypothetical protein